LSSGVTTMMSLADMVGSMLLPVTVMNLTEPVGTMVPMMGAIIMMSSIVATVSVVFIGKIFLICFLCFTLKKRKREWTGELSTKNIVGFLLISLAWVLVQRNRDGHINYIALELILWIAGVH